MPSTPGLFGVTMDLESLVKEVKKLRATHAAIIEPSLIRYSPEFRLYCEQNKCGHYGTNWMCPPLVGPFDKLRKKAARYEKCLVFQTVHPIAHSLDWKGMKKAFSVHDEILRRIVNYVTDRCAIEDLLYLGAGPCTTCSKCTAGGGETCRFTDKAVASLEAYGIDVGELVKSCAIPYYNGKNTVSYVGCVLFTPGSNAS
jgi:predicted metal-binding protein